MKSTRMRVGMESAVTEGPHTQPVGIGGNDVAVHVWVAISRVLNGNSNGHRLERRLKRTKCIFW